MSGWTTFVEMRPVWVFDCEAWGDLLTDWGEVVEYCDCRDYLIYGKMIN